MFGNSEIGIIVIDTSFSIDDYKERELMHVLESRSLSGYFHNVISVHPYDKGISARPVDSYGLPKMEKVFSNHYYVSGKTGLVKLPKIFSKINFILAQFSLLLYLLYIARGKNIKIVRVGDPYYLGLIGVLLSKILRIKLAIRIGANYDWLRKVESPIIVPKIFPSEKIEKYFEKYVLSRCDLVAGANQNNLEFAIRNGVRTKHTHIFRYGNLIDPVHFLDPAVRTSYYEKDDRIILDHPFLLSVMRLVPVKKPLDIIEIASNLKSDLNIPWVIVGDGPMVEEVLSEIKNRKLENKLILVGVKSQAWLAEAYRLATIVVATHMGRALVESCLNAAAIVAYDVEWQSELIINDKTGVLVRNNDTRSMVDNIKKLIVDKNKCHELGINARNYALDLMSPKKLESIEINAYNELFT